MSEVYLQTRNLSPKEFTMSAMSDVLFDLPAFTHRLLAEVLFYDPEHNTLGNISLIDPETSEERFLASFDPEEGQFLIEEAISWEREDDQAEDFEYYYATDGKTYGLYETPEATADALLALAATHRLTPSFLLLLEELE